MTMLEELAGWAEERGLTSSDLDSAVHDVASRHASTINNTGLDEQIGYLLSPRGYTNVKPLLEERCQEKAVRG